MGIRIFDINELKTIASKHVEGYQKIKVSPLKISIYDESGMTKDIGTIEYLVGPNLVQVASASPKNDEMMGKIACSIMDYLQKNNPSRQTVYLAGPDNSR